MRTVLVAALAVFLSAGAAWAGVSPQQQSGAQSMSGAKVKAPSHSQDEQPANEASADKKDGAKDDKN